MVRITNDFASGLYRQDLRCNGKRISSMPRIFCKNLWLLATSLLLGTISISSPNAPTIASNISFSAANTSCRSIYEWLPKSIWRDLMTKKCRIWSTQSTSRILRSLFIHCALSWSRKFDGKLAMVIRCSSTCNYWLKSAIFCGRKILKVCSIWVYFQDSILLLKSPLLPSVAPASSELADLGIPA